MEISYIPFAQHRKDEARFWAMFDNYSKENAHLANLCMRKALSHSADSLDAEEGFWGFAAKCFSWWWDEPAYYFPEDYKLVWRNGDMIRIRIRKTKAA